MTKYWYTSPNTENVEKALMGLYERRDAVDRLIESLESYERSALTIGAANLPLVPQLELHQRQLAS